MNYDNSLRTDTLAEVSREYHALLGSGAGVPNYERCVFFHNALAEFLTDFPLPGPSLNRSPALPELPESSDIPYGGVLDTGAFLEGAIVALASGGGGSFQQKVIAPLEFLLERFEITGKLYDTYNMDVGGANKGRGEFSSVENYLMLAACLLLIMGRTNGPRTLNAVLKLNDMLMDIRSQGATIAPLTLFVFSLKREALEIEELYGKE